MRRVVETLHTAGTEVCRVYRVSYPGAQEPGRRPYAAAKRSYRLHLSAEGKSPKTVRTYVEAVQWFAAAQLVPAGGRGDWSAVTSEDVKLWLVRLLDRYSDSYANNQYRALQQFFKWYADDEEVPNPMARLKPPKVGEKVVPVFTDEEAWLALHPGPSARARVAAWFWPDVLDSSARARCQPTPWQPSTAHTRSGNCRPTASSSR
jgi:hypothetical protein